VHTDHSNFLVYQANLVNLTMPNPGRKPIRRKGVGGLSSQKYLVRTINFVLHLLKLLSIT
jgi:hypothetical protein